MPLVRGFNMEHDPANQRTSGSSAQNENYEWKAPQQVRLIKITRMKVGGFRAGEWLNELKII